MQLTTSASQLADAVGLLAAYQVPIDSRPVTSYILLQAREGYLYLGMAGLRHQGVLRIPATIAEDGEALVPPASLLAAVRRNEDADVSLHAGISGRVKVQWEDDTAWAEIEGSAAETFPKLHPAPTDGYLGLTLSQALRLADVVAPLRAEACSFVELVADGQELHCAATDRTAATTLCIPGVSAAPRTWFLPTSCLTMPKSLARVVDIDPTKPAFQLQVTAKASYLVFPGGMFYSTLPEGAGHLPIETLPPTDLGSVRVDARTLLKDLSAAMAIVGKDPSGLLQLALGPSGVTITAENRAIGRCSYTVPADEYNGTAASYTVTAGAVHLAARALGKGSVTLHHAAGLLRIAEAQRSVYLRTRVP